MTFINVAPTLILVAALAGGASAADGSGDGEAAFRALYKELVETNTSHSVGSCTLAAERMSARLKAAGYTDQDIRLFAPDEFPQDGGLVAVLHGTRKAVISTGAAPPTTSLGPPSSPTC